MFAEHEQREYNHSCFATVVILRHSKRPLRIVEVLYYGADNQIRTGDLVLTKDVLYQLSHISTHLFCSLITGRGPTEPYQHIHLNHICSYIIVKTAKNVKQNTAIFQKYFIQVIL